MPRGKFDPNKVKPGGEYSMDTEMSAKVEKLIAEADKERERLRKHRQAKRVKKPPIS